MRYHRAYLAFRPFSDNEAWWLFKLAAFAEAVGWTLLITGVFLRDYVLQGNAIPVTIAGRIHGILFISYIIAVIALSPSLGWSLKRTVIAGLCSVPPYGSLIYEQVTARRRQRRSLRHLYYWAAYYNAL